MVVRGASALQINATIKRRQIIRPRLNAFELNSLFPLVVNDDDLL
jgi:hypothetical protein